VEIGKPRRQRFSLGIGDARGQEGVIGRREPLADGDELVDGLPFGEHHFGLAEAKGPVMVDPRELEVFGGKMGETAERLRCRDAAVCQILKKRIQPGAVHAA
jgi:hypothetical protein